MSIQLTVMSLDFDSEVTPFVNRFSKKEITLGRLPTNDVVLDTVEVSGNHAVLKVIESSSNGMPQLTITDLGSTNGTLIENSLVEPEKEVSLAPHERVKIGNFLIKPIITDDDFQEVEELEETVGTVETVETTETVGIAGIAGIGEKEERVVLASDSLLTISGHVGDSPVEDLIFDATELLPITGKVLHKDRPLAGVLIDGGELGKTTTSSDGSFEFPPLPEETTFSLKASKKEFRFAPDASSGKISEKVTLTFTATQLFAIRGKVIHHGKALAGVEIDGGKLGKTTTGPDGSYVFKDVPEGTEFRLTACKDGFLFDPKDEK